MPSQSSTFRPPDAPALPETQEATEALMAAVREAGTGAVAPSGYSLTERLDGHSFKIGSVPFRIGAALRIEFNDNITGSSTDPLSDLIVTPEIYLSGSWQMTRYNTLSLTLGFGYSAYLSNSELNTASRTYALTPGFTALSFKAKVGNLYLRFYDNPEIGQNSSNLLTLPSGVYVTSFTNTVGFTAFWDFNDIQINGGYQHLDTIPLKSTSSSISNSNGSGREEGNDETIDSLQNSQDSLNASVSFRISDYTSFGIDLSASQVTYKENIQNNGITYTGGVFLGTQLSEYITLRLAAGYQQMDFDSNGSNQDTSNYSQPYGNLELRHRVNRFVTHTLSIGQEGDLGTTTNSVQTTYVREAITLQLFKDLAMGIHASYETGEESNGPSAQSLKLLSIGVSCGYSLSKRLNMGVYYQFVKRDGQSINNSRNLSDSIGDFSPNYSYTQNVFGVTFSYAF